MIDERIEKLMKYLESIDWEGGTLYEASPWDEGAGLFLMLDGWMLNEDAVMDRVFPEEQADGMWLDEIVPWGYQDEYDTCLDCGKVLRTEPTYYGWMGQYIMTDSGYICLECVGMYDVIEEFCNDPHKAITWDIFQKLEKDFLEEGFTRCHDEDQTFEAGYFPGQDDDPKTIYKELVKQGWLNIIFVVDAVGQFDVRFFPIGEKLEE